MTYKTEKLNGVKNYKKFVENSYCGESAFSPKKSLLKDYISYKVKQGKTNIKSMNQYMRNIKAHNKSFKNHWDCAFDDIINE
ncbi:3291_t:CDS:1, partial [Cetraspora pellucida]